MHVGQFRSSCARVLGIPLLLFALLCLGHAATAPHASAAAANLGSQQGCDPFAAPWDSDWSSGTTVITFQNQSGNAVTGTYDYMQGMLNGTADGPTLTGTWSQAPTYQPPNDAGDFQFTLSADGCSFTGQWRYGSSGDWQPWNGKQQGS